VAKPVSAHELALIQSLVDNPSSHVVGMTITQSIGKDKPNTKGNSAAWMIMKRKGLLRDNLPKNISELKNVSRQILEGILYCKLSGIIHHDIKFSNILWDGELGLAQLCDFQ